MYYDLHIHSCLSPCAEEEMTPNNICNMALLKGLDLIAVSDHNSCRQQPGMKDAAQQTGIRLLYGAELQSMEEVHILALFRNLEDSQKLQAWIDTVMPSVPNDPDYFGSEKILNGMDELIGIEERLLLVSLNAALEECIDAIHACSGIAVPAHVMGRENSIMNQLGFIPEDLDYDALEIRNEKEKEEVLSLHPWMKEEDTIWLIDSDAHRLVDIPEREHQMSEETLESLWRKRL